MRSICTNIADVVQPFALGQVIASLIPLFDRQPGPPRRGQLAGVPSRPDRRQRAGRPQLPATGQARSSPWLGLLLPADQQRAHRRHRPVARAIEATVVVEPSSDDPDTDRRPFEARHDSSKRVSCSM